MRATVAFLLAIGLTIGCGKGKEDEEEFEDPASQWEATHFTVTPDAKPFFGSTPFTVQFTATVKNAKGTVKWEWDFRDGGKADIQNPAHTFTTPGLYTVGVAGTDETGERDGGAVIVRAMTDEEVQKRREALKARGMDPDPQ